MDGLGESQLNRESGEERAGTEQAESQPPEKNRTLRTNSRNYLPRTWALERPESLFRQVQHIGLAGTNQSDAIRTN
jgi:hypothetical protein